VFPLHRETCKRYQKTLYYGCHPTEEADRCDYRSRETAEDESDEEEEDEEDEATDPSRGFTLPVKIMDTLLKTFERFLKSLETI